jgi:hypothetical protein
VPCRYVLSLAVVFSVFIIILLLFIVFFIFRRNVCRAGILYVGVKIIIVIVIITITMKICAV